MTDELKIRMTEIARKWMRPDSEAAPEFYWGDFYDCVEEIMGAAGASEGQASDAAGPAITAEVHADAERWRYVAKMCFGESYMDGEYIGIMLPRPRKIMEGSTEDEFRATVDAAIEQERRNG